MVVAQKIQPPGRVERWEIGPSKFPCGSGYLLGHPARESRSDVASPPPGLVLEHWPSASAWTTASDTAPPRGSLTSQRGPSFHRRGRPLVAPTASHPGDRPAQAILPPTGNSPATAAGRALRTPCHCGPFLLARVNCALSPTSHQRSGPSLAQAGSARTRRQTPPAAPASCRPC